MARTRSACAASPRSKSRKPAGGSSARPCGSRGVFERLTLDPSADRPGEPRSRPPSTEVARALPVAAVPARDTLHTTAGAPGISPMDGVCKFRNGNGVARSTDGVEQAPPPVAGLPPYTNAPPSPRRRVEQRAKGGMTQPAVRRSLSRRPESGGGSVRVRRDYRLRFQNSHHGCAFRCG